MKRDPKSAFKPIHKHVMFKLTAKNNFRDTHLAKKFLKELVQAIQMNPVTEAQAFDVKDEGNEGITASINLSTSHIALHNWAETGLLMLDVYSCCYFDTRTVLDIVDKYWTLDKEGIRSLELDRFEDRIYNWHINP